MVDEKEEIKIADESINLMTVKCKRHGSNNQKHDAIEVTNGGKLVGKYCFTCVVDFLNANFVNHLEK